MRKNIFIGIVIFIALISCNKNTPEGVWISVHEKEIIPQNGYHHDISSLILDFEKNETRFLSTKKESAAKFTIDTKSSEIIHENDTIGINFKIYDNDSLELYFEEMNTTKVLVPMNLNHELNNSKKEIINFIVKQRLYSVNDTLIFEFSQKYFEDDFFTLGTKDKRVFKTSYTNEQFHGYWYIGQKNNNYFLIINPSTASIEEYIFQITNILNHTITVNEIETSELLIEISELKPVYNNQ